MDAIRIHHADSEQEVEQRHRQIIERLEHFGPEQVRSLVSTGGLPTQWNPIITAWLRDDETTAVSLKSFECF